MIPKAQRASTKKTTKRKIHGKGEYTDHVWRYNGLAGGMVMVGVYDAAPSYSLTPIADTRIAVPDMNTRHGRAVTRKASATPSLANVYGPRNATGIHMNGEW